MLTIGSLFSGIGGLELGLEWAGLGPVVWQVEKDPFCRQVLAKHWPDVERFDDVRAVGADLPRVDIICGGFPCQDISSAGKGAGLAGERSGLWREFARIIRETAPRWVVIENVASGARRWVDAVCGELGQLGYEVLPVPLSAADVGAPHLRRRIFLVAYSHGIDGREGRARGVSSCREGRVPEAPTRAAAHAERQPLREQPGRRKRSDRQSTPLAGLAGLAGEARPPADSDSDSESTQPGDVKMGSEPSPDGAGDSMRQGLEGPDRQAEQGWAQFAARGGGWAPVSPVCGVDDGISKRVDRLKALGNAVVPQCAEVVGWIIRELSEAQEASVTGVEKRNG